MPPSEACPLCRAAGLAPGPPNLMSALDTPTYRASLRCDAGGLDTVGFTGTAAGLTRPQSGALGLVLAWLRAGGAREFHHGICTGADEDAAIIASALRYECHGWPGRPDGDPHRSALAPVHVLHDLYPTSPMISAAVARRSPELARNHVLARRHVLVACPSTDRMRLRSGTWATVRYACSALTPILLVLPDGRVVRPNAVYDPTLTFVQSVEFAEVLWSPVGDEAAQGAS